MMDLRLGPRYDPRCDPWMDPKYAASNAARAGGYPNNYPQYGSPPSGGYPPYPFPYSVGSTGRPNDDDDRSMLSGSEHSREFSRRGSSSSINDNHHNPYYRHPPYLPANNGSLPLDFPRHYPGMMYPTSPMGSGTAAAGGYPDFRSHHFDEEDDDDKCSAVSIERWILFLFPVVSIRFGKSLFRPSAG